MKYSPDKYINEAIRYYNSISHLIKNTPVNKRFITLYFIVGFLISVILLQFIFIHNSQDAVIQQSLVAMKSDIYASNYDSIIKNYGIEKFEKMNLKDKCNTFFDNLYLQNNDWKLDNYETKGYDDNLYSFDAFINYKKSVDPELNLTEEKLNELEKEYFEKSNISNKAEKKIVEVISILRVFSKCFVDPESTKQTISTSSNEKSIFDLFNLFDSKKNQDDENIAHDLCLDTESRIFPWFTNLAPVYTRWDDYVSVGIPNMDKLSKITKSKNEDSKDDEDIIAKRHVRSNCFMTNWQKSINGKGYVISASDGQVNELKKLALLLRAVGNTLPIQIVHKGDLSQESQAELIKQFRRPIKFDSLPTSYEDYIVSTSTDSSSSGIHNLQFPPQEIWFVNVAKAIKTDYKDHFHKYANKLLAYLFNSFEDMIMIDTDTIPFIDLTEILEYPEYVKNGAYFFHDRQVGEKVSENQVNYFERLFPSKLDEHFFGIKQVTGKTTDNRYFKGKKYHFMESGVVVINRKKHFSAMLMALKLNFWGPTSSKIHGDKELFWLGMSLSGDENYSFNEFGAASIGEITTKDHLRLPGSTSKELCSNHPGHIDNHHDKNRLIWMNSGFTYCKNVGSAGEDKDKPLYKGYTEDQLKKLYTGIVKIRQAIIPPPFEIKASSEFGNPVRGWTDEHKYCWGYTWCAYEFIGDGSLPEQQGTYINFEDKETKWFDFMGDLWMVGAPDDSL